MRTTNHTPLTANTASHTPALRKLREEANMPAIATPIRMCITSASYSICRARSRPVATREAQ
jgi:hypothetical protein